MCIKEVLSEVIILQLADRTKLHGAVRWQSTSPVSPRSATTTPMEIWQLGQRDLVLAVQGGAGNEGSISQMHSSAGTSSGGVSDNDAFTYQGGLFNRLNVLQVGDDNTTSIYQIDNNNEVFVVQEQFPLGAGRNAALIVQAGVNNWASALQLGAQQMLRSMQFGNDNSSTISQTGSGNRTSVLQDGSGNVFSAAQS